MTADGRSEGISTSFDTTNPSSLSDQSSVADAADVVTGSGASVGTSLGMEFSEANADFVGGPAGFGDPLVGAIIGGVHIEKRVGAGGMGCVYVGRHLKLNAQVAVKVVKPEIASARTLRRFEFEAQVLATLDHDAIVRIRHADVAKVNGLERPFIVMDYVVGAKRLDEHAKERSKAEREWLELFRRVSEGVAAAHAKGVVHRDLKPGNILVTPDGRPHVIDFGVALVREQVLAEAQPTEEGAIGTPRYMSPEQARGALQDVDVTSDVYALGIVMYEAISGRMPYDIKAVTDAASVITNVPPVPLAVAKPGTSRDLCTIVMKCLEKEKSGRYSSAAELAADIRRFLADEAIVAASPTAYDTVRRLCRRHRALATAAASILATLVMALVIVTAFYVQSERRRLAMEKAFSVAEGERQTADHLLAVVVRALGGPSPRDVTEIRARRARLLEAARGVRENFHLTPTSRTVAVQGRFLNALGMDMMQLGLPNEASELFREARSLLDKTRDGEADTLQYLRCLMNLAHANVECGDFTAAIAAGDEAVGLADEMFGPGNLATLQLRAIPAMARMSQGSLDEAIQEYRRIEAGLVGLSTLTQPRDRAAMLTNYGEILRRRGDLVEAESRHREAVALWKQETIHDDPREGIAINNLGEVLRLTGRLDEAEACHQEAIALHRAVLPAGHFLVSTGLSKLGEARRLAGDIAEAEELFVEALEIREAAGLGNHSEAALVHRRLALVHESAGRTAEARASLRKCLQIRERRLGHEHPDTQEARDALERLGAAGSQNGDHP